MENGHEWPLEQKDNYLSSEQRKLADWRANPHNLQAHAKLLLLCPTKTIQQRADPALPKATWLCWMMGMTRRCKRESGKIALSFIHRPANPWTTVVWETRITHGALKMKTVLKGLNVTGKLKDKQHLSLQWHQYHVTPNKLCEKGFTGSYPKLIPALIRKHANRTIWRRKLNSQDWIIFRIKTKRSFKSWSLRSLTTTWYPLKVQISLPCCLSMLYYAQHNNKGHFFSFS